MTLIEVEDVWFYYDHEVLALQGVSIAIGKGETIALIGQNGGGKTTLAKHFNGLLKPTKGRVLVKGVDTKNVPANKLSFTVGYVFQNPAHQIFSSRVRDEVSFGPRNAGLSRDEVERRTLEAIERVGLKGSEDVHPYDLDYGKQKLLTIASVISMNPEVYCLDEPTTGQDHRGRWKVAELVHKLNSSGATVIVITQDMRFVAEVAKRVVLIADGKILADMPTREMFEKLELLRSAQINPPPVTLLAHALAAYTISQNILTVSEMAEMLKGRVRTSG
jgi:energy-coupling factor transport system ATP-binding protein